MLDSATSLNQDIGSWNTAAVSNMQSMFYYALQVLTNILEVGTHLM